MRKQKRPQEKRLQNVVSSRCGLQQGTEKVERNTLIRQIAVKVMISYRLIGLIVITIRAVLC